MNTDAKQFADELGPVTFDLASGHQVKVAIGFLWTKLTDMDRMLRSKPIQYLAMRFYSDEQTQPRRIQQFHELRDGKDFEKHQCSKIWQWLLHHAGSRNRFDHEKAEDFIAHFEAVIERTHAEEVDIIEHLERLPAFPLPEAFDSIDDSIFTNQTDPDLI